MKLYDCMHFISPDIWYLDTHNIWTKLLTKEPSEEKQPARGTCPSIKTDQ